jgi:hypothetical protein
MFNFVIRRGSFDEFSFIALPPGLPLIARGSESNPEKWTLIWEV